MADHLQPICKFCKEENSRYTCPRCNARYCSSKCYKSPEHGSCSETFYEAQVKQMMQQMRPTPESQKQVRDMLRRLEDGDNLNPQQFCQQWDEGGNVEEEEEEELDSDDEEDLATRMEGIDLDDSDAVWSRLTDLERESFRQMVQSGDVAQILPDYSPWWEIVGNKEAPGIVELSEEEANSLKNSAHSMQQNDASKMKLALEDEGDSSNARSSAIKQEKEEVKLSVNGGKDKSITDKTDSSNVGVDHNKMQPSATTSSNNRKSKVKEGSTNCAKSASLLEQKSLKNFFDNVPSAVREKYINCPKPVGIKPLESLIARPPSPLIRFSLLNTAASYAWMLRLFHGDHHASKGEAAEAVLSLSAALASQTGFDSGDQALSSIHMRAIQHEWLCPSDTLMECAAGDAVSLLTGPNDLPGYYLHAALADLQTVLRGALGEPETTSNKGGGQNSFLSSLQGAQQTIPRNLATPKLIRLAIKKLDFFISYSFSFRLQIREEFLSAL